MNDTMQNFARSTLKIGLEKLPDEWQQKFKMMYARDNGRRSMEDALAMPIDTVVDQMPAETLDWAMQQVERSIAKLGLDQG